MLDARKLVEDRLHDDTLTAHARERVRRILPGWLNDLPRPWIGFEPAAPSEWWEIAQAVEGTGETLVLYGRPARHRTLAIAGPGTATLAPHGVEGDSDWIPNITTEGWRMAGWDADRVVATHRERPADVVLLTSALIAAVIDRCTHAVATTDSPEAWLEREVRLRVWHLQHKVFSTLGTADQTRDWDDERLALMSEGQQRWGDSWIARVSGTSDGRVSTAQLLSDAMAGRLARRQDGRGAAVPDTSLGGRGQQSSAQAAADQRAAPGYQHQQRQTA